MKGGSRGGGGGAQRGDAVWPQAQGRHRRLEVVAEGGTGAPGLPEELYPWSAGHLSCAGRKWESPGTT